jgi:hypothetical protein
VSTSLRLIGDWKAKKVQARLEDALNVSVDVMGRTGEDACRHAIILMAQSARARTPMAPARRPVEKNPRFKHLLSKAQYKSLPAGTPQYPYFQYRAFRLTQAGRGQQEIFSNDRQRLGRISNRGLAKRSWMWGLAAFGQNEGPRGAIPGTSAVYGVKEQRVAGYVKENRLGYIMAAMPSGWEQEVEQAASNKIMAQAAVKMGRAWQGAVQRGGQRAAMKTLNDFFKAAP